jgi:hypothetical protein
MKVFAARFEGFYSLDKRKKVCCMQLTGLFSSLFGKEERGQEHAAVATLKEESPPPPPSLLVFISPFK